jgi:hypothetical protein
MKVFVVGAVAHSDAPSGPHSNRGAHTTAGLLTSVT